MDTNDYYTGDQGFRHPDANRESGKGLPPEPINPDARRPQPVYRPPLRRRGRAWRRLIGVILLLALLGAATYVAFLVSIVAKISTNSWQLGGLSADAGGRTNILVLGIGDAGHAGENLTDTMMLMSLNSSLHRSAQISIPRDLRVNIPGYGYSKINAANAYGGVPLAEQTVSNTLGVPINYYLKTNFTGLKDLVDAVGGLDINVKTALIDPEYPCDYDQYKACGLNIQPGEQHMDGARVLQYVRCRKGTCGNDFGRAARQQEVLSLLRPKLTDWHVLLSPAKLKKVADAVQAGVATDMGLIQLLEMAQAWQEDAKNQPVRLVLSTAPGGYLRSDPAGTSDLLPIGGNFNAISEAVKGIFSTP